MAGEKILVIDDELVMCNLLGDLLADKGYKPTTEQDSVNALELVKTGGFDLIITDLKMPNLNGIDILREVKKIDEDIVVIVITGYGTLESAQEALRLGAYDYITKPFEIDKIFFVVRRALASRRLAVANKELMKKLEEDKSELEKKVNDRTKELYLIHKVGQEILSTLNLDAVLQHLIDRVSTILDLEICSILLYDDKEGALTLRYARGLDLTSKEISETKIRPSESISGWVYAHKQALLVDDVEKDPRFAKVHNEKYYTKSLISVPIEVKKGVIGVMNINNKRNRMPFNADDLRVMKELAVEAGIAIENALLYKNLQDVYLKTISALASTIDARDHYTFNHSIKVAKYAAIIAKEMGISEDEIGHIKEAAQLHDIGKIGISDSILSKPGKLTDKEWKEIKLHSLKGAEILSPLTFMKDIVEMVEESHEWFNGSGYPKGLKRDEIRLGARIIHVADAVDTMASERAYHKGFPVDYIKTELEKGRGKQFDPKVVDVFFGILKKRPDLLSK